MPSDLCTDEEFIRRAYLDMTGTLPTPKQVQRFVADKDAQEARQADRPAGGHPGVRLLLRQQVGRHPAGQAAGDDGNRRGPRGRSRSTTGSARRSPRDKPYDEFVRDILSATGDESKNPPTVWYKELQQPEQFVDDIAQVFLGPRIACANCHHHPYEKWSQDDYWGLAAFFGRVGQEAGAGPRLRTAAGRTCRSSSPSRTGGGDQQADAASRPTSSRSTATRWTSSASDDPRQKLADWMTDPKNPFFARAVANRYWAHFFGRGIVDPLDDMRVTNPPSNPELLDALAKDLVDNKFSLKALVKTICQEPDVPAAARMPNEFNKHDKQAFARYYPKRLAAEVLLDAVCQVTDSPTQFGGLPQRPVRPEAGDHAAGRVVRVVLPGRVRPAAADQRVRVRAGERGEPGAGAAPAELATRCRASSTRGGGRADALASAKDPRPDAEKVEELFLLGVRPQADAGRH